MSNAKWSNGVDAAAAVLTIERLARVILQSPANAALRDSLGNGEITPAQFADDLHRILFRRLIRAAAGARWQDDEALVPAGPLNGRMSLDARTAQRAIDPRIPPLSPAQVASLYENLLGFRPSIKVDGTNGSITFSLTAARGSRRKTSGSYYTPPALVKHLLDTALEPVIDDAAAGLDGECAAAAILNLRVCDPACGTGHFLISAARRLAERLASVQSAGKPNTASRRTALREVVQHCIFGVDLNPLAVDLCRALLWLEAGDSCLPLSFVDHIKCGHGLLGAPPSIVSAADAATDRAAARQCADRWCASFLSSDNSDIAALPAQYRFFHWQVEFAEVFARQRGGFDAVVGNPPFLNQLENATAHARGAAAIIRARTGGAVRGYADTAFAFLLLAVESTRPGGRVALVQPQSLLSARDAGPVRDAVLKQAALRSLWICNEHVFDASIFTCAPVLQRDGPRRVPMQRHVSPGFVPLPCVEIDCDALLREPSWAHLLAEASGIPAFTFESRGVIGDLGDATADFRDQYYGLDGFLIEDHDLTASQRVDVEAFPPLITTGQIDLAVNHWGRRSTRVLKQRWQAPRIDRRRMEREGTLGAWITARLVPKILLATQTRVLEVFVDADGRFVPLVPLITITPRDPEGGRIWHIAAALASPVCTALALRQYAGAAMTADAIKLSAAQTKTLPLPIDAQAWDQAARLLRNASITSASQSRRLQILREMGQVSLRAFVVSPHQHEALLQWWWQRLVKAPRVPA